MSKKFGDIACIVGADNFIKTLNDIKKTKHMNVFKNNAFGTLNDYVKSLKSKPKDEIAQEIQNNFIHENNNEKTKMMFQAIFPQNMKKMSKETLLAKLEEFGNRVIDLEMEKEQEEIATKNWVNKDFWTNFVAQKGKKTAERLDYDITPMFQSIGVTHQMPNGTEDQYSEFSKMFKYISDPIEKTAFEAGFSARKKWEYFLNENGVKAPKNYIKDHRPAMAIFEKIDKMITKNYPDEAKRAEAFEQIAKKVERKNAFLNPSGKTQGTKITSEKDFLTKILAELEK
jgi:hypothetical protein